MKTLRDLMDLSNRVAVVTGGAGTLGLAFCESLAELGATVCILDISEQRAQERAQQIAQRFPVRTWAVGADITIESDVDQAVHRIVEKHGRLDILVNNAAYSPRNLPTDGFPLEGQNLAQWDAQLAVILTGTFLVSRACARPLANHAKGTIINIASIYGLVGPVPSLYAGTALVNEAHYAAGKGGIVQLTRYLATTLAPSVRVNCIAPGGIKAQQPESFHERYNARTPMGRMANPEDMKGALAYLASDLSSYMTGQVLAVDGGWTAW
jgi:NAD(P)-dependent dehydrogenase (short-subunit alcohol dehydrogenase family)